MFFNAKVSQMIQVTTVPREVRVAIAKARHQCSPSAMEDTHLWILFQCSEVWHFAHSGKALP